MRWTLGMLRQATECFCGCKSYHRGKHPKAHRYGWKRLPRGDGARAISEGEKPGEELEVDVLGRENCLSNENRGRKLRGVLRIERGSRSR